MLSKRFLNNKFYQVKKWAELKNGTMKETTDAFDSVEKAKTYIDKSAKAANFAGAEIWVVETSRPITADDFKSGKYQVVDIYPNY